MHSVKRRSFNPANFNSQSSIDYDDDDEMVTKGITKGITKGGCEVVSIDVKKLESMLDALRENSAKPIRSLEGPIQDKFKQMVSYVNLLYDTEHYSTLYKMIMSKFANVKDLQPGTVGAYFAGCFQNVTGIMPNCSPICAGSVPPPKRDWTFCEDKVIWGVLTGSKYTFTELNQVKSDKALLFVNHNNPASFPGLTDDEKMQLMKLGVKEVKLMGYTQDGRQYIELSDQYVPVMDVKSRLSIVPAGLTPPDLIETKPSVKTGSSNTALILLLVVLILIILFVLWKCNTSEQGLRVF